MLVELTSEGQTQFGTVYDHGVIVDRCAVYARDDRRRGERVPPLR